ncbi:MAG: hypothetical protein DRN24_06270 [Thermoplasmata archaeon]|nr:MAG: hypothetical protein DRN24_06270 [Thermoplasmata archaeon]
MDRIPCSVCRQCNRKGKPSVSRFSAYCDSHVKEGIRVNRSGMFQRIKDFIYAKRYDEEQKNVNVTKGFRPSWFWR